MVGRCWESGGEIDALRGCGRGESMLVVRLYGMWIAELAEDRKEFGG